MVTTDRRAARRMLGAALAAHADPAFLQRGYRRSSRALAYRRPVAEGYQRWTCDFELHPGAGAGGMYLFPAVELVFPPVIEIARRMMPPGSAAMIHYSLRLAVAPFAPPAGGSLIVRSDHEAAQAASWLAGQLDQRLGQVVDALSTVEGFAKVLTAEALVEHPMTPVSWVSVAAAHLHLGDPGRSLEILQRHVERHNPDLGGHCLAFLGPRLATGRASRPVMLGIAPA